MEGKHSHVAKTAGLFAAYFRADGLGRVLDEDEATFPAQGGDFGHIRHVAVEVHHHHGLCARREGFFNVGDRDHAGVQVHVRPDQPRAFFDIRIGRGREGVRRHDHFVAGGKAAELGRHFQRGAAVHGGEATALGHALVCGKFAFKGAHVFPLGQGVGMAHGLHHHGDFLFRVTDGAAAEIDFEIHGCSLPDYRAGLSAGGFGPGL